MARIDDAGYTDASNLTSAKLTGHQGGAVKQFPGALFYTPGGTDVALADGGTGASLTDPNADRLMFWDDSAGAVTWLDLSGLSITGTTLSISDAELSAIAGLTSAADRLPYFTGSGTASLATFTAAGRAILDDADAAAQRTTLGIATTSLSANQYQSADSAGTSAEARTDKVVWAGSVYVPAGSTAAIPLFRAPSFPVSWSKVVIVATEAATAQITKAGSGINGFGSAVGVSTTPVSTTTTDTCTEGAAYAVVPGGFDAAGWLEIRFEGTRTGN